MIPAGSSRSASRFERAMKDKPHRYAKRYPELALFPDRASADEALKSWQIRVLKTPGFWVRSISYAVLIALAALSVILLLRRYVSLPTPMIGGLCGGISGGSAALFLGWTYRKRMRRYLRERLNEAGIPVCIPCGYDLRGQTEPRCPERGAPFDPGLIGTNEAESDQLQ